MSVKARRLTGKRRWFATRLIPILIVLGGVYVFDLEEGAKEALLASMALPFIITEVLALVRGRLPSSDISERAIDFLKEAWEDLRKGKWGHGIALIIGYTAACLGGFFFALLLEDKTPGLASFFIFLKYYVVCMLLVAGFYIMASLFPVRGIRALTFHGILWGLLGICIVGYLNALNNPEYLVKIGFIAQLTAFLFCLVSGVDELKSGSREGQGKAILLSIVVILGLFFISYLCLGKTSVTKVLNIVGFSSYGYSICLIGLATFGYATVIHGIASRSKGVSILGVLVFVAACLAAYYMKADLTPLALYKNFLAFIHSEEVYPVSGIILICFLIFLILSYKWINSKKGSIRYPLAASLILPAPFGFLALLSSNSLSLDFGSSAIIKLFGIFIGLFVALFLTKNRGTATPLLSFLLIIGAFSLTSPLWYGMLIG